MDFIPAWIKLTENIILNSEFQLWEIRTNPSKTRREKKKINWRLHERTSSFLPTVYTVLQIALLNS